MKNGRTFLNRDFFPLTFEYFYKSKTLCVKEKYTVSILYEFDDAKRLAVTLSKAHLRNKKLLLKFLSQPNASKFAIFYI